MKIALEQARARQLQPGVTSLVTSDWDEGRLLAVSYLQPQGGEPTRAHVVYSPPGVAWVAADRSIHCGEPRCQQTFLSMAMISADGRDWAADTPAIQDSPYWNRVTIQSPHLNVPVEWWESLGQWSFGSRFESAHLDHLIETEFGHAGSGEVAELIVWELDPYTTHEFANMVLEKIQPTLNFYGTKLLIVAQAENGRWLSKWGPLLYPGPYTWPT